MNKLYASSFNKNYSELVLILFLRCKTDLTPERSFTNLTSLVYPFDAS